MSYKVVNASFTPGKKGGEDLLTPLDVNYVKGNWQTEDDLIANCSDADAIIAYISRQPFSRRVIEKLSKCMIIAGSALGFESIDLEAASEHGIAVTNVPDYCLDEVSGRAIALMLALSYKIIPIDKLVKEKQVGFFGMLETVAPIFRTRGQTLGLIGCSKIGTATALKAKGLGMRVIAYDPYLFGGYLKTIGIEPVDLDTLLKESDFISLHVPATPETKNLMSYEQFKKMKRTAYIINTSRGVVINETDLIKALQEKLIAGAGLDVIVKEPVEKDNPLIAMPNVILTGHSGWYSVEAQAELASKPFSQVVMALEKKWPLYAVNPQIRKTWLEKWGKK